MKLRPRLIDRFPGLAWVCHVDREAQTIDLSHGRHIELREQFFVEGVWSGDFEEGNFVSAHVFFGSGASIDQDSITFVSSYATTDWLCLRESDDSVVVSNSLSLLLAHLNDSLDPTCTGYCALNNSVIEGIHKYARDIPTVNGGVRRLLHSNIKITRRGCEEFEKPMPPEFRNYSDYAEYLKEQMAALMANARASTRRSPLKIYSTQSRGYDTTAVNAVAAPHAVDGAFTIRQAKTKYKSALDDSAPQSNDDGTGICETLGIPAIPIDRRSFATGFPDEYLFYAGWHEVGDANMLGIRPHLEVPAVLLTGALGEIWYTKQSYRQDPLNDELKRWDGGGHGMTEWRLEAGFIQLPVPYIGARRRENIHRITHCDEMAHWRLNVPYDRPIPRRLAEDAGVPREMFGQVKLASVLEFPTPATPIGAELRSEFFGFLVRERLASKLTLALLPIIHRFNEMVMYATPSNQYRFLYYLERLLSRLLRREFKVRHLLRRLDATLFVFCVNKRAVEYRAMLPSNR